MTQQLAIEQLDTNGIPDHLKHLDWYVQHFNYSTGRQVQPIQLVQQNLRNLDLDHTALARSSFTCCDLSNSTLYNANLFHASLIECKLERAQIDHADLKNSDCRSTSFRWASILMADFTTAKLPSTDLHHVWAHMANFKHANMIGADLRQGDFTAANFQGAQLQGAKFYGATLHDANFQGANLSGATGLLDPYEWICTHFEWSSQLDGFIVYKRIGNTEHKAPRHWSIQPGATIREVVNQDPGSHCACGINFGTPTYVQRHYTAARLWRCLLDREGLATLTVPYNTDGKARTGALTLIEEIHRI